MIRNTRYLSLLLLSFIWLGGWCQLPKQGLWAGTLQYGKVSVPFSFEIMHSEDSKDFMVTLLNGGERMLLAKPEHKGDSVRLAIRPFDAFVQMKVTSTKLAGTWEKPYRNLRVTFSAQFGSVRMKPLNESVAELDERWEVTYKPGTQDAYPGVALWQQTGNVVQGTVMTEVGDFRHFEGIVDGDSLKVSSFDGAHGFYMLGKKTTVGWSGIFHFDPEYSEKWVANAGTAELRDPFDLVQISGTKLAPYYDILAAGSGRNAIDVSELTGKVLVIQLFGTWCPNSFDETQFLVDWYATKPNGVEVVAVTFEPNTVKEYGDKRIADYKDYFGIPYNVYLGGRMSKSQAAIAFPFMDRIEAFPTLVIVDKTGNARYVHSYFNGPATGSYFEDFKSEFTKRIAELVAE